MNGEQVDSKNIKKHKNDVFRLAQLITANTRQVLSPEIAEDMKKQIMHLKEQYNKTLMVDIGWISTQTRFFQDKTGFLA